MIKAIDTDAYMGTTIVSIDKQHLLHGNNGEKKDYILDLFDAKKLDEETMFDLLSADTQSNIKAFRRMAAIYSELIIIGEFEKGLTFNIKYVLRCRDLKKTPSIRDLLTRIYSIWRMNNESITVSKQTSTVLYCGVEKDGGVLYELQEARFCDDTNIIGNSASVEYVPFVRAAINSFAELFMDTVTFGRDEMDDIHLISQAKESALNFEEWNIFYVNANCLTGESTILGYSCEANIVPRNNASLAPCYNSHLHYIHMDKWFNELTYQFPMEAFHRSATVGRSNYLDDTTYVYNLLVAQVLHGIYFAINASNNNRLSGRQLSIASFLQKMSFFDFYEKVKNRVLGHDEEIKLACYYVYSYLEAIASNVPVKNLHFFITGKSGCGKTEFVRTIRSIFKEYSVPVPVLLVDISNISPAGYRGVNFTQLVEPLYAENPDGIGLVFMDEFDKQIMVSGDSREGVYHGLIQDNFLMALDGDGILVEDNESKGKHSKFLPTDKTLFVGLGAFDGIRKIKNAQTIGFTEELVDDNDIEITFDDIAESGGKQELLGRFINVLNFKQLSRSDLEYIFNMHLEEFLDKPYITVNKLTFKEPALTDILDLAKEKRGVRAMLSELQKILTECDMRGLKDNKYYNVTVTSIFPRKIKYRSVTKKSRN